MWHTVTSISSLLLGTAILLLGNGLLGTTVGTRAGSVSEPMMKPTK